MSVTASGRQQPRLTVGRISTALTLSGIIAGAGFRRGSLTVSGAGGAMLVGSATYLAGGWRWSSVLLTFFVSSSALSRLESRTPGGAAIAQMSQRGAKRDLVQALANGGVATAAALAGIGDGRPVWSAAFAGAFAAANADTWATEIGALSPSPPRLITTNQRVPAGTSGGVTAIGLLGTAGGAALIGVVAGTLQGSASARWAACVTVAGLAGTLVDSLAGATIQAAYYCPQCDKPTESPRHHCGTVTSLVRGRRWVTNDLVNVVCTIAGAATGALLARRPAQP